MKLETLAKTVFIISAFAAVWVYGALSPKYNIIPYPQFDYLVDKASVAASDLLQALNLRRAWWYKEIPEPVETAELHNPEAIAPGYVLVSGISKDNEVIARIVDNQGQTIYEWDIDWFRLWPEPDHLEEDDRPKRAASAHIHGMVFMPNGDLVFNFENSGMIRINSCSEVVWRLPYRTHHSIHLDENGNFWVSGRITRRSADANVPNHKPPYDDFTVLEVSPTGELLSELSIFELLIENDLGGLLYLSTKNNWATSVTGDTLHLNDVESFPSTLSPGVFDRGDIMVSLRNINGILVFDKNTRKIKYMNMGTFIRQHDPDFVDGNTISVFDNNNLSPRFDRSHSNRANLSSKIVILDALANETHVLYEGSSENPFFTDIMGKHQWLPNGNVLITESRSGRAFEITSEGELVWEYHNVVGGDAVGLLDEAQRLPPEFDAEFFANLRESCNAS